MYQDNLMSGYFIVMWVDEMGRQLERMAYSFKDAIGLAGSVIDSTMDPITIIDQDGNICDW
jgi:hypothetical protein